MATAVHFVVSKLLWPLWRKAENDDDEKFGAATEEIQQIRGGVVTRLCLDYGLINDTIYFTSGEVLGGVPLREGDAVNAIAVRDGVQGGWRAIRVERQTNTWEDMGEASLENDFEKLRPLVGTVTSCDRDGGFINQTTFFPRSALCEGYEPMKGDWVQAQYIISATHWSSQARSVSPLRYRRLNQVRVSSVFGSSGVVEDSVFFSLDSLLLPTQYRPSPGDLVSVVVVESSQSFYCWRALCMAPSHSAGPVLPMPGAELESLLENKEGLVVSENTDFGALFLGESRELPIWIENKGSEPHLLKCCDFAGWDSQEQFTFILGTTSPINGKSPLLQPGKTWLINGGPPVPTNPYTAYTRARSSVLGSIGGYGLCPLPILTGPVEEVNAEQLRRDEVDGDDEAGTDAVYEELRQAAGQKRATRTLERGLEVAPGQRVSVTVGCRGKSLGRCAELLLLHFPSFTIGRRLVVAVSSREETLLMPSAPYSPALRQPTQQQPTTVRTVMGPPPIRTSKRHLPNFLGSYPVPQILRDCLELKNDVLVVQPQLGEPLSMTNMQRRFSTLLWLDELHAENELREFSISGALLRKGAVHLHLEVPGLAEGRPNLFIGDKVHLKKPLIGGVVVEYIGYVTEINEEDVSLRVNYDFHKAYLGEPLDVEFSFNRLTMRRCHLAINQAKDFGEAVLFPSVLRPQDPQWVGEWGPEEPLRDVEEDADQEVEKEHDLEDSGVAGDMVSVATQTKTDRKPKKEVPSSGQFFNRSLNPAQREVVKHILAGDCRPTPYVLFGPPGTGKTVTLIEAILQVYHRVPSSRLLVCTPSNSAADLVCIRLHDSGFLHSASLARVNASCRQEESIPQVLQQYSRAGEDIRHASFHRIVVSTCSSAGMFYQIGLRVGHFTHVFLDEAGQATEPECLIPIGLLSEKDGQIVLAGDPCQLGPVVKSKLASVFGLGVSLLERLMATPLYACDENGYNAAVVTKLLYNYRSHEALLSLPSRLFYAGDLCMRAQRSVVDALCHWGRLPTKRFPFIFHGVRATEMREGNNPSWFNPGEAVQVMLYCCQLAKRLYNPISPTDIGIIAPYRKQVEKIRVLLHRVGLADIKVGSVEEFQGQEFLVIILSTVRSNEAVLEEDLQSVLGFLSNPKRFNVAITRAKALLIVVGNPHILIKDPCFNALLQYAYDNGAFIGSDPPVSLSASKRANSEKES
ncbi:RNA helicase Mov10l1 [Clupea harengus]|uniref:RNA helicase n=1 Tax=Clupea harengus TaxID=7950 RepID=A0A6P8EXU1_CLUHA|nr:RNA helicase Mov10l1 [Clupea harengus]XP_031421073.1 RNA helicase Mov10l1 [Clupea harengus]